jgi:hypothetical protein
MQDGKQGGITPFQAKGGNHTNLLHVAAINEEQKNWPTPMQMDHWMSNNPRTDGRQEQLPNAVAKHGQAAPASSNTSGNHQESWRTPTSFDWKNTDCSTQIYLSDQVEGRTTKMLSTPRTGATDSSRPNNKGGIPLADQARREHRNWATPQTFDHVDLVRTPEKLAQTRAEKNAGCMNLREQVHYPEMDHSRKSWATPNARDPKGAQGRMARIGQLSDLPSQTEVAPTGQWNRANGKLNPRWVETLMGLPIGWTMPSCTSPQTIALMSCDSSAMESCQPPQSELLELFFQS